MRLRIEQVLNAAIANGQRGATLGKPAHVKLIKATRPTKRRGERPGNSRPVWVEHIAPRAFDVSDERRARSLFRWDAVLIQIP